LRAKKSAGRINMYLGWTGCHAFVLESMMGRVASMLSSTKAWHPATSRITTPDPFFLFLLEIIYDLGKGMESHPSNYRDKDEETLRDHIVVNLRTHYPSATAETFNKSSK